MEEINTWIVIANTAGAIVVVVLFLKHLDKLTEQQTIEANHRQEVLKHIGDDCHAHSRQMMDSLEKALSSSQETIRENTRVLGGVATALTRFEMQVEKITDAAVSQ